MVYCYAAALVAVSRTFNSGRHEPHSVPHLSVDCSAASTLPFAGAAVAMKSVIVRSLTVTIPRTALLPGIVVPVHDRMLQVDK